MSARSSLTPVGPSDTPDMTVADVDGEKLCDILSNELNSLKSELRSYLASCDFSPVGTDMEPPPGTCRDAVNYVTAKLNAFIQYTNEMVPGEDDMDMIVRHYFQAMANVVCAQQIPEFDDDHDHNNELHDNRGNEAGFLDLLDMQIQCEDDESDQRRSLHAEVDGLDICNSLSLTELKQALESLKSLNRASTDVASGSVVGKCSTTQFGYCDNETTVISPNPFYGFDDDDYEKYMASNDYHDRYQYFDMANSDCHTECTRDIPRNQVNTQDFFISRSLDSMMDESLMRLSQRTPHYLITDPIDCHRRDLIPSSNSPMGLNNMGPLGNETWTSTTPFDMNGSNYSLIVPSRDQDEKREIIIEGHNLMILRDVLATLDFVLGVLERRFESADPWLVAGVTYRSLAHESCVDRDRATDDETNRSNRTSLHILQR